MKHPLVSKHEQLKDLILDEIVREGLSKGDRIPSRNFWRRHLGASNDTINRALRALRETGILTARPGSGTYLQRELGARFQGSPPIRRTRVLDVLVPREREALRDSSSPHVLLGRLDGVARAGRARGLALSLHFANPYKFVTLDELLQAVRPFHDGVVFLQEDLLARLEGYLVERRLPFAVVANLARPTHAVRTSVAQAYRNALSHLARIGRRRIACLSNDPASPHSHLPIIEAAAPAQGLTLARTYWVDKDIRPVIERLLADYEADADFDALLCRNDRWALSVLEALKARGVRVPDDVALIGCDDIPQAAEADPPLATLAMPFEQCGEVAVEKLAEMIETGTREFPSIELEARFVPRASAQPKER